ncbi:MAG TPA: flagellar basal-body rod protein FlgF [Verrucomicrobiae bacterium]|nr:flagellar basal-body rod protein FlgF [Verrucomicrobiae bacterium]
MDSGYYAAFTGLVARIQALDVIANNLANINTTGFRGQREFYRSVTADLADFPLTPLNQAINNYGVLGGSDVDLRQGNLTRTGNPTDLAISGPGFFVVQSPGGIRYTRNGTFRLSPSGQLVTQDGQLVLGPRNLPIQVPPGKLQIASDGTVSVAGATVGQVQLVEFSPATPLVPEGNSNFIAPDGAASPATQSQISQDMLESSNLNPIQQTVTMMALQRHSELLERTLSIFQNDFDKTAETDLARD